MKVKKLLKNSLRYVPQVLVLFSVLTSNVFFPALAIAQELSDLPERVEQSIDIPVIDDSEDILEEGISTSIYEEEEAVEPLFVYEDGVYTLFTVVEGQEYVYPDNVDVRVMFNEVSEDGNLVIKRVVLSEEEKSSLNTSDDYGWDITSSMSNGSFNYDLTLPNTQGDDVEVKYTEDGSTYESVDSNIEINSNIVSIEGLEHFTMFVVTQVDYATTWDWANRTGEWTRRFSSPAASELTTPAGDVLDKGRDLGLGSDYVKMYRPGSGRSFLAWDGFDSTFSNGYGPKLSETLLSGVSWQAYSETLPSDHYLNIYLVKPNYWYGIPTGLSYASIVYVPSSISTGQWNTYSTDLPGDLHVRYNSTNTTYTSFAGVLSAYGDWYINADFDAAGGIAIVSGSSNAGVSMTNYIDNVKFHYVNDVTDTYLFENSTDNIKPIPSFSTSTTIPTSHTSIPITLTFDEDVYELEDMDLALSNATLTSFTKISQSNYSLTLEPTIAGNVGISIPIDKVFDSSGNGNSYADFEFLFDNTSPSIPDLTFPAHNQHLNAKDLYIDWEESTDNLTDPSNLVYEYRICTSKEKIDNSIDTCFNVMYTGTTRHPLAGFASGTGEYDNWWYTVQAIDEAGNKSGFAEARKFVIDKTAPTAPSTQSLHYEIDGESLSCDSYTQSYDVVAQWEDIQDAHHYEYQSFNPTTGWIWPNNDYGVEVLTSQRAGAFIVGEGTYGFRVRAVDEAGNKSEWTSSNFDNSCQITYDKTEPLAPTELEWRNVNNTQTFQCGEVAYRQILIPQWSPITNDPTFSHYEYSSFNLGGVQGLDETVLYAPELNNTWLAPTDGTYGFAVRSVDKAGNKSAWAQSDETLEGSCQIKYDSTAPSKPVITNSPNNSFTNTNWIDVNWTGGDDQGTTPSGIKGYVLRYVFTPANGGSDIDWTTGLREVGNPKTHSGSYGHGEGKYVIYVKTIDNVGIESPESDPFTITYDTTNPTISNFDITMDYLSKYVNGFTGFMVSAKVTDSLSGINTSTCQLDGSTYNNSWYSNNRCYFTVPASDLLDAQVLALQISIEDNATNPASTPIYSRTADAALPTPIVNIPKEYYGPNMLPEIKGTALDSVSGISNVAITLRRDSDNKYMYSFFGYKGWINSKVMLGVSGTNNWAFNTAISNKTNGTTYTVTPYAWDQVHLTPGQGLSDSFTWDSVNPTDPTNIDSTSHVVNTPSQNTQITINFSGAHDALSGVKGYYYSFSTNPTETPEDILSNWLPVGTATVTSDVLSDGTWYFHIRTVDNVDNMTSTAHSGGYIVDTTPAVITWNTPTDGERYKTPVVLSASTNETMNNFRFKWQLDGGSWDSGHNTNTQDTSYSYSFSPTVDGIYHLRAQGRDLALNWSKAQDITITIDNTAPVVSDITITKDGNPVTYVKAGDIIKISAKVIDQLSTVKAVSADFSYNSPYTNRPTPRNTGMTHVSGDTYEAIFTIPVGWNEGDLYVTVAARDILDNYDSNRPLAQKLVIDNTAPVVDITSHNENDLVHGTVTVSGNITDLNLYRYWFVITDSSGTKVAGPGTVYSSDQIVNASFDWDTNDVSDGTYTIKLEARDLANNKDAGSIEWVNVVVDNTQPTNEEEPEYTEGEIPDTPAVAGAATTNPSLLNTVRTAVNKIFGTNTGTGSGSEILAETQETILEETLKDEEVLGEQTITCENPKPIKGYIYLDKNKNDEMDKEEKGIENVSIRIYTIYEGNEITIAQLKTNENGYWESEVCPGDYSIEIDQESLPKNLKTEEVLSVNVKDQEITLDISATDTRNFWQKYWYIILLVAALLITTVYIVATRKKEEVYNQ